MRIMASVLAILMVLTIACGSGVTNTNVTKENYEKITNGMSAVQVESILGKPDSTSESELDGFGKTEMWHYQLGMKAIDVFLTNGKVSSKNWTEL